MKNLKRWLVFLLITLSGAGALLLHGCGQSDGNAPGAHVIFGATS